MQNPMFKYAFIESELERRTAREQRRRLRPVTPISAIEITVDGRRMINFCSNDYLGLSKHPAVMERACEFTKRYGAGATASRLICGSLDCIHRVEEKLARLKGTESALIFNSGFQTNISLLPALADRRSLILSDHLNHRSIVEGALLCRCRVIRYRHNDMDHLRTLLMRNRDRGYSRILIVSESVFSVDGDRCDLDALTSLAREFEAFSIVDEAHATGVLGPKGMGLACGKPVDLALSTFGKACGSFGAAVSCAAIVREYLINTCAGLIYTTALPPSVIGAIDAALDLIPEMEAQRIELERKAASLRSRLQALGFDTGASSTQIIPVLIGKEAETVALSQWLESRGILAMPIRPPTVEQGKSRLRISLCAPHTEEHIERLVDGLHQWTRKGV